MTRRSVSETKVSAEIPVQVIANCDVAEEAQQTTKVSLNKKKQAEEPLYLNRL